MVSANRSAAAAQNDDDDTAGFTFDDLIAQKATVSIEEAESSLL